MEEKMREDLKDARWTSWTEEELQILKKWYPVDPEEAVKRIPLHTKGSIGVKASHLGLTKTEEQDSWTKEEEEILKEWYPVNRKEAAKKLPGRSADAICAKAQRMGLAGTGIPAGKTEMKEAPLCRKWTMEEDSLVREFYPSEGPSVANRLPGRTESACTIRASVLGVTYTRNNNRHWSDEEDQVLRTFWKTEGAETSSCLPLRSRAACAARAGKLSLEQPLQAAPKGEAWSLEDLAIFMNYFRQERFAVMNRMAGGHTSLNCEKIAKYLGYLPAYSLREGWSEGEDKIIADVYPVEKAETVRLLPKRTR